MPADFPALRLPCGAVAAWWHWIDSSGQFRPLDFGRALLWFHDATAQAKTTLEPWDIAHQMAARIDSVDQDKWNAEALTQRWATLKTDLANVEMTLGNGPIHGDAHPGNFLPSRGGGTLLDLETVCIGPREWDLVPMAVVLERYGRYRDRYHEFVNAYGTDVRELPSWGVLADLRKIGLTLRLIESARTAEHIAEAQRRLNYWSHDDQSLWNRAT